MPGSPRKSGTPRGRESLGSPRVAARSRYTDEQLADFRQSYQTALGPGVDKAASLPAAQLGTCLRSLGLAPTEAQLAAFAPEGKAVDFEQVLEAIAALQDDELTEDRAKAAFSFFDGGSGRIAVSELRTLLSTRGEPIEDEGLLDAWLATADPEGKGFVERDAIVQLFNM